jgi:hypothetical protein
MSRICVACRGQNYSSCEEEGPLHTHSHTSAVATVALVQDGSVDLSRINKWLASILWPNQDKQDNVLRAQLEKESMPITSPSPRCGYFESKESCPLGIRMPM